MRLVSILAAALAAGFALTWPSVGLGQAKGGETCTVTLRITEGPAAGDVLVWSGYQVPVPGKIEVAVGVGGQTCWFAHSITDEILAAMRTYKLSNDKKNWVLVVIHDDESPNAPPIKDTKRNLPRELPSGIEMMRGLRIANARNSRSDLASPEECLQVCRDDPGCIAFAFVVDDQVPYCSLFWKGMKLRLLPMSRYHSESWAGLVREGGYPIVCSAPPDACPGQRHQFLYREMQ